MDVLKYVTSLFLKKNTENIAKIESNVVPLRKIKHNNRVLLCFRVRWSWIYMLHVYGVNALKMHHAKPKKNSLISRVFLPDFQFPIRCLRLETLFKQKSLVLKKKNAPNWGVTGVTRINSMRMAPRTSKLDSRSSTVELNCSHTSSRTYWLPPPPRSAAASILLVDNNDVSWSRDTSLIFIWCQRALSCDPAENRRFFKVTFLLLSGSGNTRNVFQKFLNSGHGGQFEINFYRLGKLNIEFYYDSVFWAKTRHLVSQFNSNVFNCLCYKLYYLKYNTSTAILLLLLSDLYKIS